MQVFVTGGTGWVGGTVVDDLLGAGYRVLGLARSDSSAAQLVGKGVEVVRGSLDDLDVIADAAKEADAVMHLAFNHDFSRFLENAEQERRAIEAMGDALIGTQKVLLVTSGLALLTPGRAVTEADAPPPFDPSFPRKNEVAATALADRGVKVSSVRLAPTVHGVGDQLFMASLAALARDTGVSAYVADGSNRWAAVHVSDAGRLYRLALEADAPQRFYHAAAEEGVAFREIAEAIGRALGLPVEPRPQEHFGALSVFAAADAPASSAETRKVTGWTPVGPSLLTDLADTNYFRTD